MNSIFFWTFLQQVVLKLKSTNVNNIHNYFSTTYAVMYYVRKTGKKDLKNRVLNLN